MQGVIRTFDPQTGEGVVVRDTDRAELVLAANALDGSLFRMLRQGQRVNFELDADGRASASASAPKPTWDCPPPRSEPAAVTAVVRSISCARAW